MNLEKINKDDLEQLFSLFDVEIYDGSEPDEYDGIDDDDY